MAKIIDKDLETKAIGISIDNFYKDLLLELQKKNSNIKLKKVNRNVDTPYFNIPSNGDALCRTLCPIDKFLRIIHKKGFLGIGRKVENPALFAEYRINSANTNHLIISLRDPSLQESIVKVANNYESIFPQGILIYSQY